ncbi:MAG TPA: hypothetical protein VKY89_23860 [Thermoanaerobaculia bacterium]|nr:hypothetical protein [Thermoanaerobaculia bacterium]
MLTSLLAGERTWDALSASEVATLRGLPQVGALIEAGRSLRSHDVHATLRFARLARYAADRLNPKELGAKPVADLRALAWVELANAYRICDDLPRASQAMNRSVFWSSRGSRSSLLLARIAVLLGALLSAQRRLSEAVEVLGLVYKVHALEGRPHLAGRALISMGQYTTSVGEPGRAIVLMRQGLDLVDQTRDPILVAQTLQAMLWCLVDLGRFRAARRLLWSSRIVLEENPNALDRLRVRWLEGRIYAGLCDFARAEAALLETRAGFAQREQVYPAALAGLDLATLWARQGRFEEVRALAQEMIVTFRALRIAREAIVTLLILQRACVGDGGQLLEIIEMVVTFLNDLERQPARRKE